MATDMIARSMAMSALHNGGGTTVDQTYSPTSENAQSGTAVAEALETIPSVTVDQTFNSTSANPQSGTAVASALKFRELSGFLVPNMAGSGRQNFPDALLPIKDNTLLVAIADGGSTANTNFIFTLPAINNVGVGYKRYPVFENGVYCCDIVFQVASYVAGIYIENYNATSNFTFSQIKLYQLG